MAKDTAQARADGPEAVAMVAAPGADASAWTALAEADDLPAFAAALERLLRARPGFGGVCVAVGCGETVQESSGALAAPGLRALLAAELAAPGPDGAPRAGDGGFVAVWREVHRGLWLALAVQAATPVSDWLDVLRWTRAFARGLVERRELRRSVARLENAERLHRALYAIADMASARLDMPEMLRGLHRIVGGLMYAENFFIALYDPARRTLRFPYFADTQDAFVPDPEQELDEADLVNSLTMRLIRHGQALRGPSVEVRRALGMPPDSSQGPDAAYWLGVPLVNGEEVCGAIVVQSYDPRFVYTDEDRALLSYVARHILTALERKQHQAELERHVVVRTWELALANEELKSEIVERQNGERLQAALFRIAQLSTASESLEAFYAAVHGVVGELLYARNFFIARLLEDGSGLEFPYSVDERDTARPRRALGRGLTEYVLRTGQPLLADRRKVAELAAAGEARTFGTPAVHWLGVPLRDGQRTIGVLVVQSYSPDILFSQRDQELLTFVSLHIANGMQRRRAQERLLAAHSELERRVEERTRELAEANAKLRAQIGERLRAEELLTHQASHDALTGLPNRAFLFDRMQAAMGVYGRDPERLFAVLFLDLDRFKVINDSVGHLVGDEVLKHAARRIASAVRQQDVVARLGGDEFAVLVADIEGERDARDVAERIIAALVAPMPVGDKELFTSASVGIALASPRYRGAEEILRDADTAMYRAKAKGRNRSEVFDRALHDEALRTLDLENDLRRALIEGRFEPYYQPIVSLEDGARVGYEALLRWNHDSRGVLAPESFLAVAEEGGLIEQIDWLIYERVFRDMGRLLADGEYVCINVSARHFHVPGMAERLLGLLRTCGADPSRLRIELTEGALLDEAHNVSAALYDLRVAGVRTQLDDFGTGYSALSYLHRYPIAAIKIDRSFVAELDGNGSQGGHAVVRAILALAQSLGLETIGEGIETPEQRRRLAALGCERGQGFLFAAPAPLAAVAG
ncbi:EAL domain-containing protein [Coralloluteibacterium thermophilus]|uniref:EAL domain-containing protein n=1 Tax=Coralloluteibacterium thermophilum TaxID=2707049 RepID=A0ABV9NKT1_9GAMM